jgi:hypothetical protein
MRRVFILSTLALAAVVVSSASAQSSGGEFSITRSVVAPAAFSSGGAFAMTATVGQPTTGTSGSGAYQLQSGYAANVPTDVIFANGFEP